MRPRVGGLISASPEVPPVLREVNAFCAALRTDEGLVAYISADAYSTTIQDFSVEDLVGLVDRAE